MITIASICLGGAIGALIGVLFFVAEEMKQERRRDETFDFESNRDRYL